MGKNSNELKIILIIVVIMAWILIFSNLPSEHKENIWLPESYSFVNRVPIEHAEINPTAIFIAFEDYKRGFSDSHSDIILVLPDNAEIAEIYYVTGIGDKTFYSLVSYGRTSSWKSVQIVELVSDSELMLYSALAQKDLYLLIFAGLIIAVAVGMISLIRRTPLKK